MEIQTSELIFENYLTGKKRLSAREGNNLPFATLKDKRIAEERYMKIRARFRRTEGARRAKSVRDDA